MPSRLVSRPPRYQLALIFVSFVSLVVCGDSGTAVVCWRVTARRRNLFVFGFVNPPSVDGCILWWFLSRVATQETEKGAASMWRLPQAFPSLILRSVFPYNKEL